MKKENIKKESFIRRFCKSKGWNPNELSTNQMLVIVNKKEYKEIDGNQKATTN